MRMRYFHFIQNKCLLLFVLTTLGCYVTDATVTDEVKSQLEKNSKEIEYIKNSFVSKQESSVSKDYNLANTIKGFQSLKIKLIQMPIKFLH